MQQPDHQTVLVTGATDGLGRALARRFAQLGTTVIVHGRDRERLDTTCAEIRETTGTTDLHPVLADLAELRQVDALADRVAAEHPALHTLVNNAGVGFGRPEAEREVSADGIELRFAVNHLAAYHLARRLSPLLAASAPARIVQVASAGQQAIDLDDPLTEHGYDGVTAYRRSKLAQVMATFDLGGELAGTGVTVNALHPATFMDTTMVRDSGTTPTSTLEEGLTAAVRLALDPSLDDVTGEYFLGTMPARAEDQAYDAQARDAVRRLSDELVANALAGESPGSVSGSARLSGASPAPPR